MHKYVIAIPSYQRDNTLKIRTLATLESYNIPTSIIYIFVANKKEKKKAYISIYSRRKDYHKIIKSKLKFLAKILL